MNISTVAILFFTYVVSYVLGNAAKVRNTNVWVLTTLIGYSKTYRYLPKCNRVTITCSVVATRLLTICDIDTNVVCTEN